VDGDLPDSPAGLIIYALRKPVARTTPISYPPYTYEYYKQPIDKGGSIKTNLSKYPLPAKVISKLKLDSIPYGVYPSPTKKYILITQSNDTGVIPYIIDRETNKITKPLDWTMSGFFYGWHPDGEHFIFGVPSHAIWLVEAGTMEATEIVSFQTNQMPQGAAISPDGQQVAFIAENYPQGIKYSGQSLWIASIQGSDAIPLVSGGDYATLYPTWSLDGTRIVFSGI
jgi:DNA-binding beta-propeller fold protein YncE